MIEDAINTNGLRNPATPQNSPDGTESGMSGGLRELVSRFVIARVRYPEYFMGFNEFGFTNWTSYKPGALRVSAEELGPTMARILATAYYSAEQLSAKDAPLDQPRGQKPTSE